MDLYTQLSNSMEELTATFEARMKQYDDDLHAAVNTEASHKSIASLSREFLDFKCIMWKTVSALKAQMELMLVGLDRHEMMSRREVLLLHGLEEHQNEDCPSRVTEVISGKMKVVCSPREHFVYCHRLGTDTTKPRPLLIRFQHNYMRSEVWNKKTLLKGSGLTLSEFLTKPRHETFLRARKHFGVRQCWTSEGKVVIQLPNKMRRKIESAAELRQLILEYPMSQVTSITSSASSGSKPTTQPVNKLASSGPDKRSRKTVRQ